MSLLLRFRYSEPSRHRRQRPLEVSSFQLDRGQDSVQHWRFVRQCARRGSVAKSNLCLETPRATARQSFGLARWFRGPKHWFTNDGESPSPAAILAPALDNVAKSSLAASNFHFSYATLRRASF